uniref:Uncharacterized protein n=1 Tax=Tanacetum cinerariifolium TaxID=118510 RepID=A0A6L2KJT6_TANCI|nr:hypothetical protein [Tanacetum cinerariifolium]
MSKRDEMAARNHRSKVDSSSIQVADADDGGLPKDKKNYRKSSNVNEVLHPKPSPNTKSSVRRLSKEVAKEKGPVKPKAAQVSEEADVSNESEEEGKGVKTKFFKGKEKIVVSKFKKQNEEVEDERNSNVDGSDGENNSDKEHKGSEEANLSNESGEEGMGVKAKGFKGKEKLVVSNFKKRNKEVEDDVEGNESEKDKESEEDKETEVSKESDDSEMGVKDVKMKCVKEKVSKPKKVSKKKKQVKDSYDDSSSSEEEKVSKPKKVFKKKKQVNDLKKKQVKDESSSSEDEKPLKNKKHSKHAKDVKTVPSSLFASMRDSQVDMESFQLDIGFSSFHNVFIDTLPQQFARLVVRAFSASSYEFKLEKEWFKQFDPKTLKEIRVCDIAEKLVLAKTVDFMFKVNFLMLFANVMGTADTVNVIVNLTVLRRTREDTNIVEIDWCGSNRRFYDVCVGDNVSRTCKSSMPATDKKGFCSMIEEKISMISAEKIALEDLFKKANAEFPNNGKVSELYKKYRRLFKESIFVKDLQAHTDDFDNNDYDGGGKNNDHGSDNVGKKKESVGKDVVNDKKDGVNATKDGVNVVQEGEANVNEEP